MIGSRALVAEKVGPARVGRWCRPASMLRRTLADAAAARWLLDGLLPRASPVMWLAPSKAGKSWGSLDQAFCVAAGLPWLGRFKNAIGRPARVLFLTTEDDQLELERRLDELGRGYRIDWHALDTLHIHTIDTKHNEPGEKPTDGDFRLPEHEAEFIADLVDMQIEFVVIDHLTDVMSGNQNAIDDAKAFADSWARVCARTGATVMFLHHTNKPGDGRGAGRDLDRGRGSNALTAKPRVILSSAPVAMPPRGDGGEYEVADVKVIGNLALGCRRFALAYLRAQDAAGLWVSRLIAFDDIAAARAAAQGVPPKTSTADQWGRKEIEILGRQLAALEYAAEHRKVHAPDLNTKTAKADLAALEGAGYLVKRGPTGGEYRELTDAGVALLALDYDGRRRALKGLR